MRNELATTHTPLINIFITKTIETTYFDHLHTYYHNSMELIDNKKQKN